MRESIGGTWILQLVIVFILIFSGYIILTLNYSKTIKFKNEALSIIEKYEGINDNSIEIVNNFLKANGYNVRSTCVKDANEIGIYGATDLNKVQLEKAQVGTKYYYCVKKFSGSNRTNFYQLTLFYRFNLPIFGDLLNYVVKGTTGSFISQDGSAYADSVGI